MAKVAVITGSNGLIGQATCRRLAQSGHLAVGVDVGPEGAGNWPHYQCDLRDLTRMEATLADRARLRADPGAVQQCWNLSSREGLARRTARPVRRHDVSQCARDILRLAVGGEAADCRRSAGCDRQHRIGRRPAR